MKKFMSLLMAIVMVFCLATPIKAAEEFEITHPGNEHTYEIYQIFTGDYSTEKDTLSNIKWGENGTGTKGEKVSEEILNALLATNGQTDTQKLAVIKNYVDLTEDPFTTLSSGKAKVAAGYYLIKDVNDALDGAHDAYTTYIVEVVKNVDITIKSVFPTVDKQVWDEPADAEDLVASGWNETADHNLNETFQFKLIANLPASTEYEEYETYTLVFTDTMSEGITFEKIVSVTVDGVPFNKGENGWTCSPKEEEVGQSFTLTIANIKVDGVNLTDGAVVEVIYDAHLNEKAAIGNYDHNHNTVYLEYSNNPNAGGEGDFGRTTPDTVWVFTYRVNVIKVDGTDKTTPLPNAQFKLRNANGEYVVLVNGKVSDWGTEAEGSLLTSGNDGKFYVEGLDHGTYQLVETVAPDGYNLLDGPVTVTISATHAEDASENTASTTIKVNDVENGTVTVENKKGITLPSTGGMGTTLFYIIGGLLFAGAVVLLITKKRMNEE